MRNICKAVESVFPAVLTISQFILETDPAAMQEPEKLYHHRLYLIARGSGSIFYNAESHHYRQGTTLFCFSGETVHTEPKESSEYMYIDFSGPRADELFRRFGIGKDSRCFSGFDGLIPLWQESLSSSTERTVDLAAESMLLYAFSRFSLLFPGRSGPIAKILELTEAEFTDPGLSLTTLSRRLGYNAKYLSHLFKEEIGISYSNYLRTLRVKSAVILFDHGLDSIKNVAQLCGFSDPLYFSSVFKSSMGMPPSVYVAQTRKQSEEEKNG